MRFQLPMILTALLAFGAAPTASSQTINWQDGHIPGKGHWSVSNDIWLGKEVAKATNGRLKITVFPSASSGFMQPDQLNAVSKNLLQISSVFGGGAAGQERVMELFDIPQFVPPDYAFRVKLWDALYDDFAKLLAKRHNVWLMDVMSVEPRSFYTRKKITRLSEAKGLKVRTLGNAESSWTKSLGMDAAFVNWTELYSALQQGVVDAMWSTDGGHMAQKFYEVTKYILNTENAGSSIFTVVSQKALDELPADVRSTFMGMRDEYRKRRREAYIKGMKFTRGFLLKKGMVETALHADDRARMLEASRPVIAKWAASLDPESRKIFDKAKAMIDAHRAGS